MTQFPQLAMVYPEAFNGLCSLRAFLSIGGLTTSIAQDSTPLSTTANRTLWTGGKAD